MCRYVAGLLVLVCVAWLSPARADDAARAVIDRAIRAQGGEAKLRQETAIRYRSKGRVEIPDRGWADFTQEMAVQAPGKFRETMHFAGAAANQTETVVFDGTRVWVRAGGQTRELPRKAAAEFKELAYLTQLGRLIGLRGDRFKLETLGETKVGGKPAVGVKVSSAGHRDVRLYFSTDTGLLVKLQRPMVDLDTGKERTEERVIDEYENVGGHKVAKKAAIFRDGKKVLDVEVVEVKFVDHIDDKEFARP
jgi:hypothetical protein